MSKFNACILVTRNGSNPEQMMQKASDMLANFDINKETKPYKYYVEADDIQRMAKHYGIDPTNLPILAEKLEEWKAKVALWETGVMDWERVISDIFDKAVQELDKTKRIALYHEWQEIVAEELPAIYLPAPLLMPSVRNKFINLKPSVIPELRKTYHNIETELEIIN